MSGAEVVATKSILKFRPEDKRDGEIFYIGILPESNVKVGETVHYNFTIVSTVCRIWENQDFWDYSIWTKSSHCFVGDLMPAKTVLACDCSLLSQVIGGHVYAPSYRTNPFSDFSLFTTKQNDPLAVVCLIILLSLCTLLLIWAKIKDKKSRKKINVIVLEDNDPRDSTPYLVGVFTGARIGGGTTSNVGIRLFGDQGFSKTHILNTLHCPILECNSDNWYILFTPHHLGTLTEIILWTDYSGRRPNWYCSKIIVFDMTSHESDFFFVESWLGTTTEKIHLETSKECAIYSETNNISRIISENLLYGFMESHYWVSVFLKHPRSSVSRAQRLMASTTGLLISIGACAVLYGPSSQHREDLSSYTITNDTIIIGMIGSFAETLVTFVIMHNFYRCYTLTNSPSNFQTNTDCRDIYHLSRRISRFDPNWLVALRSFMVQYLKPITVIPLQSVQHTVVGIYINQIRIQTLQFICFTTMIICCHVIVVSALQFGKIKALLFWTSVLYSMLQTCCVIYPLKIFTTSFVLGVTKQRYYELMTYSVGLEAVLRTLRQKYSKSYKRFLERLRNLEMYDPPTEFKIRELAPENQKFIFSIVVYYTLGCICFLGAINWIVTLIKIRLYFLMNMETLCAEFGSTKSCQTVYRYDLENIKEFWDSLDKSILPALFCQRWYNGNNISLAQELFHETGWMKNGNSRLVGPPRLRQLRVKPDKLYSCRIPEIMKNIANHCQAKLNKYSEDKANYGISWGNNTLTLGLFRASPWKYTEPFESLDSIAPSGYYFHGGGYIAILHRTLFETRASLSSLYDSNWLDDHTRLVTTDFLLYNVNENIFTVVKIVMEVLEVGSVTVIYRFKSIILLTSFAVPIAVFLLSFVIFTFQFLCLMNIVGAKKYLSNFWNLYDFVILIVFIASGISYFHFFMHFSEAKATLSYQGKDVYFPIEETMGYSDQVRSLIGALFCLMLFRFLRIIRFNEDVRVYTQDLLESRIDILFAFLVTALFMFVQFRLIMYLVTTPAAPSLKDILIFKSQFKNIVHQEYHEIIGKVLGFLLNFTSQLGICTFMLSQHHQFKKAQETRVQNIQRRQMKIETWLRRKL